MKINKIRQYNQIKKIILKNSIKKVNEFVFKRGFAMLLVEYGNKTINGVV
ncbi:hypothetical protein [Sporosalibacterium faouarense]|nr:hypothetical protein [Sporosalibacterium faouarense]